MSRRGRRYYARAREVEISTDEIEARKWRAVLGNIQIKRVQIARSRTHLEDCLAQIEAFGKSRGLDESELSALRDRLSEELKRNRQLQKQRDEAIKQRNIAINEIKKLELQDRAQQPWWRVKYHPSPVAREAINQQRRLVDNADNIIDRVVIEDRLSAEEKAFVADCASAKLLPLIIEREESKLGKLLKKQDQKARREKKLRDDAARTKGLVSAYLGKTRSLADGLKKQLLTQIEESPNCPYCGNGYGAQPHLDHIYPVSKGGISIADNLVLICSSCNSVKHNKTLREFIIVRKLDREQVESNLTKLRKTF